MKRLLAGLAFVTLALAGCASPQHADPPLVYATPDAAPTPISAPTPTIEAHSITVIPPGATRAPTDDAEGLWRSCLAAARVAAPTTIGHATILPFSADDLSSAANGLEIVVVHGTGQRGTTHYKWTCAVTGTVDAPATVYLPRG